MGLQRHPAGQAFAILDLEGLLDPIRLVVGAGHVADLALPHQLVEGGKRFFEGRVGVVEVGVVEIDVVGLQSLERVLAGRGDVLRRKSLALGMLRDLGRDHDLVAVAAALHPVADDRLRLTACVAGNPGRVGVGRVDEVAARLGIGVEHLERLRFVCGEAEDVAAEVEGEDAEFGTADRDHAETMAVDRHREWRSVLSRLPVGRERLERWADGDLRPKTHSYSSSSTDCCRSFRGRLLRLNM